MADAPRGHHRSTTWAIVSEHPSSSMPNNRLASKNSVSPLEHDHERTLSASKSRRTLRQPRSVTPGVKAYRLPDPSQFENPPSGAPPAPSSSDPTDDILYPKKSFERYCERERQAAKLFSRVGSDPVVERQQASQPQASSPAGSKHPVPLEKVPAPMEPVPEEVQSKCNQKKVVVVHDAEKKFTTAALDAALREFAVAEGDAVVVVAFLQHILSPMGMKMVADLKQFSGVNQSILNQSVLLGKNTIERKLKDTNRLQYCETKKIQLDVKVLPGSNPKALVAKAIIDLQATGAMFDTNAMTNRRYYEETLSCHVLRLRHDGRRVETISLFGRGAVAERTGSTTSHYSDSSSDSGSFDSPTIWFKRLCSWRSSGSLRHHGPGSIVGSSRTSSSLGSPRLSAEDEGVAKALEESFSFDSPKPDPAEELVYAAAGVDHKFGSFARARNGESTNLPTAMAA